MCELEAFPINVSIVIRWFLHQVFTRSKKSLCMFITSNLMILHEKQQKKMFFPLTTVKKGVKIMS